MPTVQVPPEANDLLQEIASSVFKSRKIIVVTGAGISTNSGIPDFRSENGLYSLIQEQFDAAAKHDTSQTDDSFAEAGQGCSFSTDPDTERPVKRRKLCDEAAGTSGVHGLGNTASSLSLQRGPLGPSCAEHSTTDPTDNLASTDSPVPDTTLQQQSERKGEARNDEGADSKALDCDEYSSPRGRALRSRDAASEDDAATSVRHGPRKRATSLPPSASDAGVPSDHRPHAMSPGLRNTPSSVPSIARFLDAQSFTRIRARSAERAGFQNLDSLGSSPAPARQSSSQVLGWSGGRAYTPRRNGGILMSLPQLGLSGGKQAPALIHNSRTPVRLPRSGIVFSSSPLSSPPPVLFDPFQETSSATQPSSSEMGSTASSETDETPPSSIPTLTRQSSNRSRSSLPNLKGRDMFDASIWADPVRTSVFYTFATTLRQRVRDVEPTTSHRFISHLRDRGKLVRCYTQNIDQIEEKVGLSTSLSQGPGHKSRFSRRSNGGAQVQKLQEANDASDAKVRRLDRENSGVECVFLHGSLQSLRCFLCGRNCEWDESGRSLETLSGQQPECPHCVGAAVAREERGKRTLGIGKLRPDIVLYGEEHPNAHLIEPIVNHDLALYPDFLLILGTSLKVHGLKILVREFAKTVHCRGGKVVFVNFTKPPESSWGDIIDYWVQWDCDAWVSDLQHRIPLLWMPPGTKLPSTSKRKRESSGEAKSLKKQASTAGREQQSTVKPDNEEKTKDAVIEAAPQASSQTVPRLPPTRSEISAVVNSEPSAKLPQRPMSTREDRINGAFLTWQITRDLRRISGSIDVQTKSVGSSVQLEEAPPSPTVVVAQEQAARPRSKVAPSRHSLPASSPCLEENGHPPSKDSTPTASKTRQRSGPAKKPASRRSTPGWVYLPENAPEALAVARRQAEQSFSFGLDDTGKPGTGDLSLLSAVKSNPRRRKRKMIDGVEVALPTIVARPAPQPNDVPHQVEVEVEAHVLPSPKPASPTLPSLNQDAILHTSPRILSDLNRVSMNSQKLLPILSVSQRPQPQEQQEQEEHHHQHLHDGFQRPTKPMPLEPQSPPSGPLKSIAPNVMRWRDHPAAFSYFDSLVPMLKTPLVNPWTPDDQLRKETEAAVALDRLRGGT